MDNLIFIFSCLISFYAQNFIGKISSHNGYMQLSMFYSSDSSPAYNFVFRIISPVIIALIISALLYSSGLGAHTFVVWLSIPVQFCLRAAHVILFGRFKLINWFKFNSIAIISSFIGYSVDHQLISKKEFLFPNLETVGNELWLVIGFFIYKIANDMQLSGSDTMKRKDQYLKDIYTGFSNKYAEAIDSATNLLQIRQLTYAIMIVENFNRPKLIRAFENKFSLVGLAKTTGIMQVSSSGPLSDLESISLAVKKLEQDYLQIKIVTEKRDANFFTERSWMEDAVLRRTAWLYNNDDSYASEVIDLYRQLDTLNSKPVVKDRYDLTQSY